MTNLFPISRKISPNPSIVELVIHPQTNVFRITRLLLRLCNNRYPLPEVICVEKKVIVLRILQIMKHWPNCDSIEKQKFWYTSKLFQSRFTDEKTYWENHFWTRWSTYSLRKNNSFVAVWTSSMIDGLGVADPFHVLYSHLIYHFWTFFYGRYIRTNINKTIIKHLNDIKTRITEEIQSIENKKNSTHTHCFPSK